ncbi:hypothetical protein KCU93_g13, partial [Aureobasidium melanogenum]
LDVLFCLKTASVDANVKAHVYDVLHLFQCSCETVYASSFRQLVKSLFQNCFEVFCRCTRVCLRNRDQIRLKRRGLRNRDQLQLNGLLGLFEIRARDHELSTASSQSTLDDLWLMPICNHSASVGQSRMLAPANQHRRISKMVRSSVVDMAASLYLWSLGIARALPRVMADE